MLDVTDDGDVRVLRLAHGKANALDIELCEAITSRVGEARLAAPGALVLTGVGRIFSAGVDLVRIVEGGATYVRAFLPALSGAFEALFSFPRPLVAAVNGHAIAGGCILAWTADYRLMAGDSGRIGVPELVVGVPFPVVPIEIVRFAVPSAFFPAIVYRGVTFDAESARASGFVDAAVPAERLMDEAMTVARALAAVPARAFELTKQQLRAPARQRMGDAAAVDRQVIEAWASPPVLEAIARYVARVLGR
jgi:enoyl-CoA hydratase/carnithine racemase